MTGWRKLAWPNGVCRMESSVVGDVVSSTSVGGVVKSGIGLTPRPSRFDDFVSSVPPGTADAIWRMHLAANGGKVPRSQRRPQR